MSSETRLAPPERAVTSAHLLPMDRVRTRSSTRACAVLTMVFALSGVVAGPWHGVSRAVHLQQLRSAPLAGHPTPYFPSQYELHAPEPEPHVEAF